jgi:glycine cleavage system H protein
MALAFPVRGQYKRGHTTKTAEESRMSEIRYTKAHCWCREEENGELTVGITDYAQGQMSDLTFVELPTVGDRVEADEEMAVVESVKAASDVYAPVSGEVTAINEDLADTPELVNQSPYGKGWLCRIRPDDPGDFAGLLDADAYEATLPED